MLNHQRVNPSDPSDAPGDGRRRDERSERSERNERNERNERRRDSRDRLRLRSPDPGGQNQSINKLGFHGI